MKASDWFENGKDFQQLCLDAKGSARSESAEEFTHSMLLAATQYGAEARLTERQLRWLCALADWPVPLARARA